jgi:hypothetical protein
MRAAHFTNLLRTIAEKLRPYAQSLRSHAEKLRPYVEKLRPHAIALRTRVVRALDPVGAWLHRGIVQVGKVSPRTAKKLETLEVWVCQSDAHKLSTAALAASIHALAATGEDDSIAAEALLALRSHPELARE